ncbi:MAG: lipocalin family protein [Planctomycetota bacterium]
MPTHRSTPALRTVLLAALTACLAACSSRPSGALPNAEPLESVSDFDTERYLGLWYEISKYPVSFEEGLVGVTAEYSVRKDGKLKVLNGGFKGTLGGKRSESTGKAWAPDPEHPERLKVQFFWPFKGDYWVIDLDPDYRWAVVGEPKRRYLWILSRTPTLPPATYDSIVERITGHGYDVNRLERMEQPGS